MSTSLLRALLATPIAWALGLWAYSIALDRIWHQSMEGDAEAVISGSAIALAIAVPLVYWPLLNLLSRRLHGFRPFVLFPVVAALLGIIPTALNQLSQRRTIRTGGAGFARGRPVLHFLWRHGSRAGRGLRRISPSGRQPTQCVMTNAQTQIQSDAAITYRDMVRDRADVCPSSFRKAAICRERTRHQRFQLLRLRGRRSVRNDDPGRSGRQVARVVAGR